MGDKKQRWICAPSDDVQPGGFKISVPGLSEGEGEKFAEINHYTIKSVCCIIHRFSSVLRFLRLIDLKKVGVRPVIFLNW
jgi:hypothetical protein